MEVDVSKENICIQKKICEKKEIIFAEEDMIVPDTKPDVLNSINMTGNVCVLKKEIMEGKVKIEGVVNTYIMYLPDSESECLRGLNASINFSQIIQVPEAKEGMNISLNINIKDLECKVLNGRKLNIKASLEADLSLYSNEEVEIINSVNNAQYIQTLEKELQVNSLIGSNSTRVYVKDTLSIDPQDEIVEILKSEVNLVDNDIKISYNKVLSKCEVEVKIMYLTQDGRTNKAEGKIPAVGFIDMQNVSEDNICDVNNEVKNLLIRPNPPEEHSIYVEVELESSCMSYEKKNVKIIEDLYSPVTDLEFSQKKITTTSDRIIKSKNFTISSKTNIADLVQGNLLDVEVSSIINKQTITSSKVLYEGELVLNFIFDNGEKSVNSKISKIPFDFWVENPLDSKEAKVNSKNMMVNKKFDVKPNGDVECNIDMEVRCEFSKDVSIDIIDNIEMTENRASIDDYDSLILYVVMPGDTMWNIAKKFKSTIEDIAITNGIEDVDKIYAGQKLYIPRFTR